jgi:hypothetical protein
VEVQIHHFLTFVQMKVSGWRHSPAARINSDPAAVCSHCTDRATFNLLPVYDVPQCARFSQRSAENSSLLGCDAVSLGKWFPTFRRIEVLPSSGQALLPVALQSFQKSILIYQTTQCNKSQVQKPTHALYSYK